MRVAGRYRVVRRKDHAVPQTSIKPVSVRDGLLDIRIWRFHRETEPQPLLLVNASRRQGPAVLRNRFRRRVRMAFLQCLREAPEMPLAGCVVWVRPAKGRKLGPAFSYGEIVTQLNAAFHRWMKR